MQQNKQKGIALIQVLLLVGILSVLVLYFTQTSRQQIALATFANDRAAALVNLQSAKSILLFRLLTEDKLVKNEDISEKENKNRTSFKWNFYGYPFLVMENVEASLQDQSGLLSAHFLDGELLGKTLLANGIEFSQIYRLVNYLLDWQDIDNLTRNYADEKSIFGDNIRNGQIPDLTDLKHIPEITPDIYAVLSQSMTIHYAGSFNPMTAPDVVLRGLLDEQTFEQITHMRADNQLSKNQFNAITGIDEVEGIWFTPSNYLQLSITSKVGQVSLSQTWMLALNPYASVTSPVNYIETRG